MKTKILIPLAAGVASLMVGCSTPSTTLAPVGPNPNRVQTASALGQLEVFSALTGRSEGDNPSWYQHSRYLVYNRLGKRLESVGNTVGYYAEMPRLISLPPGDYLVKAQAKGHWWVEVPVKIERGRTTRVHLDAAWQMPPGTSKSELVSIPAGYPIGWRAGLTD